MANAKKINYNNLKLSDLQFSKLAHRGHSVSHAKNRTNRAFKRNLHAATIILNGIKHKVSVPSGVLKKLKEHGFIKTYTPASNS